MDARGAAVSDNTIVQREGSAASVTGDGEGVGAIIVKDVASVSVQYNVLVGAWSSVGAAIVVEANSTEGVRVRGNTLRK